MKRLVFPALVLFFMFAAAFSASAAGFSYVTVEAKGAAETRSKAINEALVEAVRMVNGTALSSRDVSVMQAELSSVESRTDSRTLSSTKARIGEDVQKRISTATRGAVKSFEIISEKEVPDGLESRFEVVISAVVGQYQTSAQTERKRMAVMPFRVSRDDSILRKYADLVAQELVNHLTQSRRFAMLDRTFLAEKHREFDLLQGDDVGAEERARVGATLGADYIVVGKINSVKTDTHTERIPFVKETRVVFDVTASFTWRVIEAPTGQIMTSSTYVDEFHESVDQRELSAVSVSGLEELAAKAGYAVGRTILNIIYPLMPAAYENGMLILNQGGETVFEGQQYELIQYGDVLIDPYTKEPIGRKETPVGLVEIVRVLPKSSQAKVLKSEIDLATAFKPGAFILRAAKKSVRASTAPADAGKKKTRKPNW